MGNTPPSELPRTREASDALAGDPSDGSAAAVRERPSARALRHDDPLRALRREPEDGLQVARALCGRGRTRTRRAPSRAAPLSASDRRRARGLAPGRPPGAPDLGPGETRAISDAAAPRDRA